MGGDGQDQGDGEPESGAPATPSRVQALWARLHGWRIALALVGVGTLVRLPQLDNSLFEAFSFRQTQTAFVAREYVRDGVDISRTPLPVLGADADVPIEMPLYQAAVAVVDRMGIGDVAVSARLVGMVSFQAAALLLYALVRRWHGVLAAVLTLVLFQLTPYSLQWGAAALIDFPAVALALGMVVGLDRWFTRASRWGLVLGSASAVLAFLVKPTTPPTWGFLLLVSSALVIRERGWVASWRRQVVGYTAGPVAGVIAAGLWARYADGVKRGQPATGFLVSSELEEWNFGTLGQRASVDTWVTIGERVQDSMAGAGLALVAMAIVLVCTRTSRRELVRFAGWVVTAIGAPVVFVNLYVVHDYYLIAVYPAITAVLGIAIALVASACWTSGWPRWVGAGAAAAAVLVSASLTVLGQQSIDNHLRSNPPPDLAVAMTQTSSPEDLWIMVGCDWDPVYLYLADRKGVMFRFADSQGFWDVEEPEPYTRLATCAEAPAVEPYLPPGHEVRPLGGVEGSFETFEVVPAG